MATTLSIVPEESRLTNIEALSVKLVGSNFSCTDASFLSCLLGRAFNVYIVKMRYKGRAWVVHKRYSELRELSQYVRDLEGCK